MKKRFIIIILAVFLSFSFSSISLACDGQRYHRLHFSHYRHHYRHHHEYYYRHRDFRNFHHNRHYYRNNWLRESYNDPTYFVEPEDNNDNSVDFYWDGRNDPNINLRFKIH